MSTKPQSAADTSSPVYICHGAEAQQCHVLSITPEPDSLWMTNQIACHQIVGDTSSSISIEPALGEFQDLPVTGAAFKLHCPAIGEDRDMEMWLRSGYTAKPHIINLKLGHFRCVIASSRAPIRAPIIGQELLASVTIQSFYTQALVKGIDVEWVVDGVSTTVTTNDSGVSDFRHIVTKEGKQTITAHLHNFYNDETETVEFPFTGFAHSPWEEATLKVNGQVVEFGKTAVMIRAQVNEVVVEIPADIARTLTLAVVEPGGLTLTASPAFGTAVQVVDGKVSWRVTSVENVSGSISLEVSSPEVELPLEWRCWVLSSNLEDEMELRLNKLPMPSDAMVLSMQPFEISLIPINSGMDMPVSVRFCSGEGIQKDDFDVSPGFDVESAIYEWVLVAGIGRDAACKLEFRLEFGSVSVSLIVELKISHVLPNFYFVEKQVSLGSAVGAYRSGRHKIRILADGTSYQGKAVKVDLEGATWSGQIVPNNWQLLVPDAEFFLTLP
ncbi:hypothetical protein [Pseudomonas sp. MYb118]|uniref:hypothetical protein n=1 Tax=Pseudomonas sp. MYb118 TaxID=1848720 RepID=UPI0034CD8987